METINPQLLATNTQPPSFAALPTSSRELLQNNYDWTTNDIEHLCAAVLVAQAEFAKLRPDPACSWSNEDADVWRDVDNRILELLHSISMGHTHPSSRRVMQAQGVPFDDEERPVDDSDVDEEAADSLCSELNSILAEFATTSTRSFVVIRPLDSRHRRHVHAIAHFSHFGHMSIGVGIFRMILLSRRNGSLPPSLKKSYKEALHCSAQETALDQGSDIGRTLLGPADLPQTNAPEPRNPSLDAEIIERRLHEWMASTDDTGSRDSYIGSGYSSAGSAGSLAGLLGTASFFSNDSGGDSLPSASRKRQKRQAGGFLCTSEGCSECFDRRCDLSHRERSHTPYADRPFGCADCGKRFLYAKDLRRHNETHGKTHEERSDGLGTWLQLQDDWAYMATPLYLVPESCQPTVLPSYIEEEDEVCSGQLQLDLKEF